jgi:ABC-type multidrug transport system ATPase subunit
VVRSVLGLIRYEGSIQVQGIDTRRRPKAARQLIGTVPQELGFYDDLTLRETLDLTRRIRQAPVSRMADVAEMVGLGAHIGKRVRELSGGMKQRLALALALLDDPPVLLLDEPTSSLDLASREHMIRLLEELRGPGRVIVLCSHNLEELAMLVDRVVALEDGRVVEECPPSQLADRLGLSSWLHLSIGDDAEDRAALVLTGEGFNARRNGHGVLVEVSAQRKATALSHLRDSGVDVLDFEVWRR